jgi:hypothetical protein
MSETTLYTIHTRADREDDLRIVADASHPLGVVPPVFAIWRGLWISAGAMVLVLVLLALLAPAFLGTVYLGLVLVTVMEGSALERAELRLRGWEEVALAEARSEEGAEEDYRQGRAVSPEETAPSRGPWGRA